MSIRPISTYSEDEGKAIQKWRKSKLLSKEDLFIAFLTLGVAVVIFLIAARILSAYPSPQGEKAQGARRPGVEQRLDRLSQELNLDDQQKAKIKPIIEEEHKQTDALWSDSSLSPQDRRAKFREIRENSLKQINPILTADQQEKFAAMRKKRMERHGGPPKED